MENSELAEIFYEIADLLEVKGENPFRIRSYRNAGAAIEGTGESLKTVVQTLGDEALEAIPGIGKSIRGKIVELLKTGRLAFLDKLLDELPAGILEILRISGIGPKKTALLYGKLGIGSVDELEKAVLAGRLRKLPGFAELTERKILKGIKDLKAFSGRFLLSRGVEYAETFVDLLLRVPGVIDVVPAGSLRRWRESIGDVDILATCTDPAPVMDAFVSHPDVSDVVSKGSTKSTVILAGGLQVDLRVLDSESFGAALQYFTGSKTHNVALRDRAKRMGLKISEYGVFKGDKRVGGSTEEEVYRSVGLPWILPELRENRGEIEAAEEGRLPAPLVLKDIRGDLHAHTTESDGHDGIKEMADAAIALGYAYLAVTDHSKSLTVAHGLDAKRLLGQIKAVDAYNAKLAKSGKRFRLLKGAEVDIRSDGTLDHPDDLLERLDCVVGAVHSGFNMAEEDMTARVIRAIRSGRLNILAHPTGRLIGARPPYKIRMEEV
jgi:DNA polymerase (family 10)